MEYVDRVCYLYCNFFQARININQQMAQEVHCQIGLPYRVKIETQHAAAGRALLLSASCRPHAPQRPNHVWLQPVGHGHPHPTAIVKIVVGFTPAMMFSKLWVRVRGSIG